MKQLRKTRVADATTTLKYQWSTQVYTLQDIVNNFKLPKVVKCAAESCFLQWVDFKFDMTQPLLIYEIREVQKLCTRCMKYNPEDNVCTKYGPTILIPENYHGWFFLPQSVEERPSHLHGVESVVCAQSKTIISLSETMSYRQTNRITEYECRPVSLGEILVAENTYKGEMLKGIENVDKQMKHTKFLKCFSESNDELLIPFTIKADFCEIPHENAKINKIFNIQKLLTKDTFPFPIRLICGSLPPLISHFTGLLNAFGVTLETTVMAATLDEDDPILMEICVTSPVGFRLALNDKEIHQRSEYNEALHMCKSESEEYLQNMKVSFTLCPSVSFGNTVSSGTLSFRPGKSSEDKFLNWKSDTSEL